jgi:cell division septation protein DedD/Tfp pilus assembly protein PilF
MSIMTRAWLLASSLIAGAAAAQVQPSPAQMPPPAPAPSAAPVAVAAPNVRAGIEAWQAGNYALAIGNWRPLADRGDADAQYNIAQAYFLGRGVPQNANLAEQWYARAARQGHEQAQANYGLLLFQNGRRREAMPWIEQAANRGDPRAQYVLGTALYNGDLIAQDLPRAYALMTRAAGTGLPPAVSQLEAMNRLISAEERSRGTDLARDLPSLAQPAAAAPPVRTAQARPPAASPPAGITPVPGQPRIAPPPARPQPQPQAQPPAQRPAQPAAQQPLASGGGRWRIQLGAFSNEANARRAWSTVSGRLGGLQPYYVRAGAIFRLQAGPLANRAAAERACAQARQACLPVAP